MTFAELEAHAEFHDSFLVQLNPDDLLQAGDFLRWTPPGPSAAFTTIDAGSVLVGQTCSFCEVYRLEAFEFD